MLSQLPILISLATLAAADFKIYFFSENTATGDGNVGALRFNGFKFLSNTPDCDDFINGKSLDADFDGDVTDSQRGGATCDGCDQSENWADWRPGCMEINDFNQNIFLGEPYHITLYGTGNGGYEIRDTSDNVHGNCAMVESSQSMDCATGWGPYTGQQFVDCATDIAV